MGAAENTDWMALYDSKLAAGNPMPLEPNLATDEMLVAIPNELPLQKETLKKRSLPLSSKDQRKRYCDYTRNSPAARVYVEKNDLEAGCDSDDDSAPPPPPPTTSHHRPLWNRDAIAWMALYDSKLAAGNPMPLEPNLATDEMFVAIPNELPLQKETLKKRSLPLSSKDQRKRYCDYTRNSPAARVYVEKNDLDVLMGRGSRTNYHPGNIRYLKETKRIQPRYLKASKVSKTAISQELVDAVHAWGGRFLQIDDDPRQKKLWYEVPRIVARKKASQKLRELNTPEARAKKRAKYQK